MLTIENLKKRLDFITFIFLFHLQVIYSSMFLAGYFGFQQFHYLKIKKSNLISNGSVQTIVVWFREKRFPQKKLIDKISVCHSSNNAIPDQILQKNQNLILFGNQVQLSTIQLKVGGCAIVMVYKL
jgi:hypothetical protein